MENIKEDIYYNIDLVPYKVYVETEKFLIIENFLNIDFLWGENEYFKISIGDGKLELTLWDNNDYSLGENIDYLIRYFDDIGTEMFNRRTLEV